MKSPKVQDAKSLLAEHEDQRRASRDLNQRVRAMCRVLGIEENIRGWGAASALQNAVADYDVSHRWPPRKPKGENGK